MDIQTLTEYFNQYGVIVIFIIVFLEHMNLPGFPAGIIMPLAGIWAAGSRTNFWEVFILSVAGGVLGSWVMYFIGNLSGDSVLGFFKRKLPKQSQRIEKYMKVLKDRGAVGVFTCKLIPVARTLVSLPAGMISLAPGKYMISTMSGIILWNLTFIGAGYFLGDQIWTSF